MRALLNEYMVSPFTQARNTVAVAFALHFAGVQTQARNESGLAMTAVIMALVTALVGILIALILSPIITAATITAATATGIGSFSGVASLLGLVPLLFTIAPIALGVGVGLFFFQKYKAG